ncbi:MAG: arylsulfatase [Bryobacteraceae bacterium]
MLNRREFLYRGAVAAVPAISRPAQRERPNLLLLMADQHRADCVHADGNAAIHTPNLDRLAAEGARFRCAYSTTPTCTPARSALLTGMSPWRHGMLGYGQGAVRYPVEMPRLLRDAGYYTLGIGKMHWHPQRNLHGFHQVLLDESGRAESPDYRSDYRVWFWSESPGLNPDATGIGWNDCTSKPYALPERLHPTAWTGETAVRFLRDYNRKEPFFLKVSFARPHSPYDPPARWMDRYADAPIPPARCGKWAGRYRPLSSQRPDLWHGDLGAEQVRRSRQGYYGAVSFVDEQIGRILETLEKRNMLERTLILYLVDHGDMTGDQYLWRKSYAYEPSARIPMLIRWPEGMVSGSRGQVLRQPVELRDALPTLLDAAGVTVPDAVEGRSLLELTRGRTEGWRPWIDLEHDVCYAPENQWNALTDGRFKYIFHARDGEEQLFDLEHDPAEMVDLAGDPAHQATLRTWRGRMIEHLSVRGERFVANGKLALRPERYLYSPYYPDGGEKGPGRLS